MPLGCPFADRFVPVLAEVRPLESGFAIGTKPDSVWCFGLNQFPAVLLCLYMAARHFEPYHRVSIGS